MDALFVRLGLNAKETDTFLKLLSLGAQPVSVVARHASVPRSTMYFIIEKLKAKHLVEEFERKGIKYVKCIPVRDIADVLRAEERNLSQTLQILEAKLPELESLENTLSVTPKVKLSEGKEAVMKLYASLSREREFLTFFNQDILKTVIPEYVTLIPDILKQHGGRAREMVVDGKEARAYQAKYSSEKHPVRLLPKEMAFTSDCIICKDKLCLITYGENQVSAIEIFSPTIVETHRALFERVWESLG